MKKPVDKVEAEFNAGGIFFLDQKSITDEKFEGNYLALDVEILVFSKDPISPPDFSVSILNRREVAFFATDWATIQRDDQQILTFKISMRVPNNVAPGLGQGGEYMSFLDLCFFAGNEAIPEVYGEDIDTRPRPGAKAVDLGWTLPSRYVDPLIDALGKLDATMLGNNMKQALLYGPVFIKKV